MGGAVLGAALILFLGGCVPGAVGIDPPDEGPMPGVADGGVPGGDASEDAIDPEDPTMEADPEDDGWGGGADPDSPSASEDPAPPAGAPPAAPSGLGPGFAAPTADPCRSLRPTIRGTDGPDRLMGTDGPDVIWGGAGDDEIWGNGGDDVICAGGGADRVFGGAGNDYIDGGFGRDVVDGGAGDDIIHGGSGGDVLRGGAGNDVIYGGLLDDELYGDEGNDLLIGGHGVDHMHGGEGDDWLRGDTNRDFFIGGAGLDTVSFMTTTPPGQPLDDHARVDGVIVDARDVANGFASGDGYRETLQGVETIVGSPFDDNIVVGEGVLAVFGESGDDRIQASATTLVRGGSGADTCVTASPLCETEDGLAPRRDGPYVALATAPWDLGLVVLGSRGDVDDALAISIAAGVITVRATNGAAITPGLGCMAGAAPSAVHCLLGSTLRYIVGYGGGGNDAIVLEGDGFPRNMETTLDGGPGNDRLVGHSGTDILFSGESGNDTMFGLAGDDALLSISADRDVMDAGPGNDQLVSSVPCGGHRFIGGPGVDVGGFARVGVRFDTAAERHRQRIHAQIGFRAHQPAFCSRDQGTQLANDIEILEGAGGDDELIGNDRANVIWGWGGDDLIRGLAGNDTMEGHEGNDTIYGGPGRDRLRGNRGFNVLHARDGVRDAELSCGTDGRLETADANDPNGSGCR